MSIYKPVPTDGRCTSVQLKLSPVFTLSPRDCQTPSNARDILPTPCKTFGASICSVPCSAPIQPDALCQAPASRWRLNAKRWRPHSPLSAPARAQLWRFVQLIRGASLLCLGTVVPSQLYLATEMKSTEHPPPPTHTHTHTHAQHAHAHTHMHNTHMHNTHMHTHTAHAYVHSCNRSTRMN